jgi:hypothetical protein
VTCLAAADMQVAYGGGIGWHGTYNPPLDMGAYSCIADELTPEAD